MVSGRFRRFFGSSRPRPLPREEQFCDVNSEEHERQQRSISAGLKRTLDAIAVAAERVGRDPASVRLVAATKTLLPAQIAMALNAGVRVIGENRVQEGLVKMSALTSQDFEPRTVHAVPWHMLGHLQKNKVKLVVGKFDLIHSVDSVELAQAINDRARFMEISQQILLQVNVSGELSKYGVPPTEVRLIVQKIALMKHVRLSGLMTIPPVAQTTQQTRAIFTGLRSIAAEVEYEGIDGVEMTELSMGMSDDFEIAIEEGATMVRIGRAIFGERQVWS